MRNVLISSHLFLLQLEMSRGQPPGHPARRFRSNSISKPNTAARAALSFSRSIKQLAKVQSSGCRQNRRAALGE
jgi:hypothetical protein